MDITETLAPKSDQLNSDDLLAGPITVTIEDVTRGNAEQPVNVHVAGFKGRPYKPNKSMRRVLAEAWGPKTQAWIGQSLTLFRNPKVRYAGKEIGGIEISHMTGLDQPLHTTKTVTRGKREPYTVQPLHVDQAPNDIDGLIADATTVEELRALWADANDNQRAIIQARVAQINQETAGDQS